MCWSSCVYFYHFYVYRKFPFCAMVFRYQCEISWHNMYFPYFEEYSWLHTRTRNPRHTYSLLLITHVRNLCKVGKLTRVYKKSIAKQNDPRVFSISSVLIALWMESLKWQSNIFCASRLSPKVDLALVTCLFRRRCRISFTQLRGICALTLPCN